MTTVWWSEADSPVGTLGYGMTERGLLLLALPNERQRDARLQRLIGPHRVIDDAAPARETRAMLAEYFAGERTSFDDMADDMALDWRGTPFQQRVWRAVYTVPYGRTVTYGDIAREIGAPRAVRAVGAANGDNPLPIVVPCHRVVGGTGHLHGYGGGLPMKKQLLALEGAMPADDSWDAWARAAIARQPGLLIGPRSTGIFCRPTCRYTRRLVAIPALFDDGDAARAAGFRPCKVCQPA